MQLGTPTPQPTVSPASPDPFLLAIVAGVVLLVIASVATVFVSRRLRTAPPPDLTTPAGVVQAYVTAIRAGDVDGYKMYLTSASRARLESLNERLPRLPSDGDERIVLETTGVNETDAAVRVRISRFSAPDDPFSSGQTDRTVTVRLVREGDTWLISQTPGASTFR